MDLFSSIFYGIIQGLAEFLPVSSSGHLAILQGIFGSAPDDSIAFNVLLHAGTLLAVLVVYFKTIVSLIPAFFTMLWKVLHGKFKMSAYTAAERFVILLIVATIPLFPASLLENKIEALSSYVLIVGAILIFNGIVLYMSDKMSSGKITIDEASPKKAFLIGLCQMVAILPGLSRSGSTITGGLLTGLKREDAVKFSFILSMPAIIGACVLELPDFFENAPSSQDMLIYFAGAATAAVVGFISIKLLTYISRHATFRGFSYYCWAIGTAAVLWGIFKG